MATSRNWTKLDAQVARSLQALESAAGRRILVAYAQALKDVSNEMAKLYTKVNTPDGKLTLAEMTKYNRNSTLEKNLSQIMNDNYKIVAGELRRLPAEMYNESFFRYGWAFDQNSGVSLSWGTVNQEAIKAISTNPLDLIAKNTLRVTTRNRIRTSITSGLIQGKTFPQMMKQIRSAMGNNAFEAMRIARTEAQRAQSEGTLANYQQAVSQGVRGRDVWDATLDGDTRSSHRILDGKKRPDKGFWTVLHNGELLKVIAPLTSGKASFDIQCRCRLRFEVEGYAPQLRRTRDAGIVPYVTYDEWKPNLNNKGKFKRPSRR